MPRRHRPPRGRPTPGRSSAGPPGPAPSPLLGGWMRREEGPDGEDWLVRSVSGAGAVKTYRCPWCQQEITPGVPHVVAWPADEAEGSVERRHWHTGCWRRR